MTGRLHHKSKNKQKKAVRTVIICIVIVVIGMLLPRAFAVVSDVVMTPVHGINGWLESSTTVFPSYFRDRRELVATIQELENELVIANRTDVTLQRLQRENLQLRNLLGVTEPSRIAAAVIARPADLPYDYLQIDKGFADGIVEGAPVYVGSDQVIGIIIHAAREYAFVELVTTPDFIATAYITGPNVVAKIEGRGGGVARVKVPQGIPLLVGDLVHLPSVEPGVFGRISYIENLPTQPEQFGYISPEISLQSVYTVAVATESLTPKSTQEVQQYIDDNLRSTLIVEGLNNEVSTSTATSTDES